MKFNISENLVDIDEIPYHQRRFVVVNSRNGNLRYKISSHDAIATLGGKCIKCEMANRKCLIIDHINGDGCMERHLKDFSKEALYNCIYYAFRYNITEAIDMIKQRYQVLCANCNMIKKEDNNENGDILHQLQYSDARSEVLRLKELVYTIAKQKGWK